jgi:hypothetical protein
VGANKKRFFNFSPQYLKLHPPIAYDLEAKQLGPQFYWSFSFGAALSLLCDHASRGLA